MNSPENNGSSILGVPLQPITVADQVAQIIQQRIFSGALRPGDRVVEQGIAKELRIGQNPVREALIRLSNLGFVQHNAHRGTYITKMTQADAEKIHRVRAALEMLVLETIIGRMDFKELDYSHVEGFLLEMKEAAKRADIVGFYNSDLQFHRALWRLANNEYLFQALERLVVPLFAFFIMQRYYPPEKVQVYLDAIARHETMVEAIKKRSTENVRAAFAQPLMPPDEAVTTS